MIQIKGRKVQLRSLLHVFSPNSLRSQLLLRSFFILTVLLLLVGIFQYFIMRQFLFTNTADNMQNEVSSIPHQVWQELAGSGNVDLTNDHDLLYSLHNITYSVAYVDTSGKVYQVLEDYKHTPSPQLPISSYQDALNTQLQKSGPPQANQGADYQIVSDQNGKKQLLVLLPLIEHGTLLGMVQVSVYVGDLQNILNNELLTYICIGVIALVIGIFVFRPILRRTLVPLSQMVDTVEKINAGNLDERLPADLGQQEVERLSNAFNAMLERLESSFRAEKEAKEQMRQFIADASHELRTPLTSIHGFLEILLRGAANNKEQLQKALGSMLSESERINKLVQDLLSLAKLDQTPELHMTKEPLGQIILDMEPQLRILSGERNVEFDVAKDIELYIDRDRIKQVVLNLFQNAVQYTNPIDGNIRVALNRTSSDTVMLSIEDNGVGIPKGHIPHLFDRFYRADTSRARKYGGAGLGLAITKSIVDIHGGRIEVSSSEGSGTTFKVLLPIRFDSQELS